ncbi:hypothetical protein PVAG01_08487 [Phlyctema vagabunda]|uniref:Isochorismatase-like domain-containing protein n=1 Tax=Phlyctema vagabunda TaxID=108571 RepID=A0ABR4P9J2_9HELO
MKFQAVVTLSLTAIATATEFTFERLDKNNAALLVVDHQLGLSSLVRDFSVVEFRNSILAHAALGNLFGLPTILTSSAQTGPNGQIPKEIIEMHPAAPFIKRNGEVDAWDNADFRAAVEATNKTQIILAGITTDVCTSFLALSLREAGYSVWANTEASGTFNEKLAFDANRKMEQAGVHLLGMFAITMDLMRDWRNTPGTLEVLPFLDQYLPDYSIVARAHGNAIENGTLVPGEEPLL